MKVADAGNEEKMSLKIISSVWTSPASSPTQRAVIWSLAGTTVSVLRADTSDEYMLTLPESGGSGEETAPICDTVEYVGDIGLDE